jgi:hypothetical protein
MYICYCPLRDLNWNKNIGIGIGIGIGTQLRESELANLEVLIHYL